MNKYVIALCVGVFLVVLLVLDRLMSRRAADRDNSTVFPYNDGSDNSDFDGEDNGDPDDDKAAEPEAVRAVLTDKQCGDIDMDIPPHPWEANDYALFFSTDTGDEKVFFVTEEQYLSAADVGESGLLVYVGETFLAFDTAPDASV